MFGIEPGAVEITHASFFEFIHPDDRERVRAFAPVKIQRAAPVEPPKTLPPSSPVEPVELVPSVDGLPIAPVVEPPELNGVPPSVPGMPPAIFA